MAEPNRIRLVNVRGKNSGTYKCKAQTDVDEVSDEMKLIIKGGYFKANILPCVKFVNRQLYIDVTIDLLFQMYPNLQS